MEKSQSVLPETPPISPKQHDAKYDILKLILSIMVLAMHASVRPEVLFPWVRIAVPLFFMLTSYFVFSKLREASPAQQKTVLKKFVLRNLLLYFCWFLILLPITLYIRKGLYLTPNILNNILNLVKTILFSSTFVSSWFIMASVIGVLLIYLLHKLLRKNIFVFFISFLAFCFVTLASSYSSVLANTFFATALNSYLKVFGVLVCSFPAALFWVFMGKLFAENKIKPQSWYVLLPAILLSCIALYLEWKFVISLDGSNNNDSYFMLAPLCITVFLCVQKIKPVYWEKSKYIKRASTIIYVSHGSVLPVISKLISLLFHVRLPFLSLILTLACCIIIYSLIEITSIKFQNTTLGKILKRLY